MYSNFIEKAQQLKNVLLTNTVPLNLRINYAFQITERYTADVVSSCIYGIDSNAFSQKESTIHKMGSQLLAPTGLVMVYYIATAVLPFMKWFYKMPLITKKSSDFFVKLTNDAIAMRGTSNVQRDDFLNYLLELKKRKNISEIDLTAHTVTFFLDGFETSSVVIAYALYYLGRYQETQNKLRKEIFLSVQKHGKITFDEITEMAYLDQVFHGSRKTNTLTRSVFNIYLLNRNTSYETTNWLYVENMHGTN